MAHSQITIEQIEQFLDLLATIGDGQLIRWDAGSGSFIPYSVPSFGDMIDASVGVSVEGNIPKYYNTGGKYLIDSGIPSIAITTGWMPGTGTWSYTSADAPTFVASIPDADAANMGVGDRLKLTQTTDKYFIVTAKGSPSGGFTPVTMYGGTDYTLANAAITSPYFSHSKSPLGFPLNPAKWTVELTDTSDRFQASPTQNTWYNPGSLSISIPIGCWNVEYFWQLYGNENATVVVAFGSLSTSNNSESDADFTRYVASAVTGATDISAYAPASNRKTILLAAKTTYYPITKTSISGQTNLGFNNASAKMIVRAVCAYL